ncbi:acetolactate synthase small subunit [Caminibacter mediatlanticus TB-2]|uniref:Acetolactate synthase small subunit n=1 Tax=Caminibacter mediatlanticus TB-2 TaxID=391592 RepID=A0AAI9AIQ5_9BACT|nr:acetolactate synthase small subunit [Caminibacter mediatlanticus]EDM24270.1 acetolactate synthase 3 small subunit [Caminibacter mediatlanticus TB-2]QCT94916.1 acetolactate synthase small subunit [Caminibacter mediatlanticus TB-2]
MKRVISVIVENEHGVLARIVNMFAARGYNITSLTVAPIPESEFSRMTIMSEGDPKVFEQIVKQLYKLIPVYKVIESDNFIEKEMAMVKFNLDEPLSDIDALARCYNGSISNVGEKHVVVSVVDRPDRIDNFLKAVKRFKPLEVVRSGVSVIER